jgi:hypothetical protein
MTSSRCLFIHKAQVLAAVTCFGNSRTAGAQRPVDKLNTESKKIKRNNIGVSTNKDIYFPDKKTKEDEVAKAIHQIVLAYKPGISTHNFSSSEYSGSSVLFFQFNSHRASQPRSTLDEDFTII